MDDQRSDTRSSNNTILIVLVSVVVIGVVAWLLTGGLNGEDTEEQDTGIEAGFDITTSESDNAQ